MAVMPDNPETIDLAGSPTLPPTQVHMSPNKTHCHLKYYTLCNFKAIVFSQISAKLSNLMQTYFIDRKFALLFHLFF